MIRFRHILVPTDFGAPSHAALEHGIAFANAFDSKLTVLHVFHVPALAYGSWEMPTPDLLTPLQEAAEKDLAALRAEIAPRVPRLETECRMGAPWEEILAFAKKHDVDLIVMGTHGRHGVPRFLLGSVAERVVRLSDVPVLTVRGEPKP